MSEAVNPDGAPPPKVAIAGALRRVSAAVDRVCLRLAALTLTLMIATVMLQVVARYAFHAPPQWTEEAARYLMLWACLMGATVSFKRRLDPVLVTPSARWRRRLGPGLPLVRLLAVSLFALPVLWYSPAVLQRQLPRASEMLGLDMALVMAVVPLALLVIVLHALLELVADLLDPSR